MSPGRKNLPATPNSQSWVIIGLLIIILTTIYLNRMHASITISEHRFETMMLKDEVKEVVLIVNKDLVEVILKPEILAQEPYKSELEEHNYLATKSSPIYSFRTPSLRVFNDNFKAIEAKIESSKRIGYTAKERYDVASFLLNGGFYFLLLLGFWFLMRRMSSGGGPGGQIFNIGKSKAALF